MSLFEHFNPAGSIAMPDPCRARNENIEGASCEYVAFGTGAHLCIRPKGHDDGPVNSATCKDEPESAVARFYRELGDNHICECGVRWK